MEPILFRRSLRAASGLPKFVRVSGYILMSKRDDAMAGGSGLRVPMSILRVFEGLA
jgi:hypothetical protein